MGVTLEDVLIDFNRAGEGGGIYINNVSDLIATDTTIENNTATSELGDVIVARAGGIYGEDDVVFTMDNTHIQDNDAMRCGGVSVGEASELEGNATSTIRSNYADGLGAGGLCAESGAVISRLDILDNATSNSGGGIIGEDLELSELTIAGNEAGLNAGGIDASGDVTLAGVTLSGNFAGADGGGMQIVFERSEAVFDNCVVHNNEADFFASYGGGVSIFLASLVSIDTDWGTGAFDNEPKDIDLSTHGGTYDWPGVATFTCVDAVGGGCL
jgi:hypothetical protein